MAPRGPINFRPLNCFLGRIGGGGRVLSPLCPSVTPFLNGPAQPPGTRGPASSPSQTARCEESWGQLGVATPCQSTQCRHFPPSVRSIEILRKMESKRSKMVFLRGFLGGVHPEFVFPFFASRGPPQKLKNWRDPLTLQASLQTAAPPHVFFFELHSDPCSCYGHCIPSHCVAFVQTRCMLFRFCHFLKTASPVPGTWFRLKLHLRVYRTLRKCARQGPPRHFAERAATLDSHGWSRFRLGSISGAGSGSFSGTGLGTTGPGPGGGSGTAAVSFEQEFASDFFSSLF